MKKAKEIKDDKFYVKENDIDAIRRRPTMIIGTLNAKGVFHLCKEIIDNNRDECIKPNSPGNMIDVVITDEYITSRDNGRGIPTDMLRIIHETSQAGSNMTRSGGNTSGENGIGSTAFTALSSFLEVTTLRPTEKKKLTVRYSEGKFIEEILEDYNGKESGLITTFKPSKTVLLTDKIPIKLLREWIHEFDYTLPDGIIMNYEINGKKYQVHHRNLSDYLLDSDYDNVIPIEHRLGNALEFSCGGKLVEQVLGKNYNRAFNLDIVLTYSNPEFHHGEDVKQSWMNMINTYEHGDHVDSVIKGYSKFIKDKVVQKNKKLEGVKLKRDIEAHLNVIVRGSCDCANMFSAQSKHRVESEPLAAAIEEAVIEALNKAPTGVINDMVDAIIGNYRARIEGEKMRNVSSTTKALKSWQKPDSYYPASTAKCDQPKELFLVEGNSAGGGLKGARNAKFQAILTFRGKSLNVWDLDIDRVLKSEVWVNLIKVLGCGIGPGFDIRKLQFDKIIISTDADIDGYHIRVGFIAFFTKFMPDIITEGRLYIAEPPLYKLVKGKEISYVASQVEYTDKCIESLGKINISFPEMTQLNNINIQNFVRDAFDYRNQLEKVSINRATNPYLLEDIAHCFAKYGDNTDAFDEHAEKWIRSLAKIYPELGYDPRNHQLKGVIDLKDQLIIIDDALIEELRYVIDVQKRYGEFISFIVPNGEKTQTTLARFFEFIEKMYPVIKARYKGLGSSAAQVSREVIMDPATRRLVRVVMDKDTMKTMPVLVGKGKDDIDARKEMLMNFKFTVEDIDN